MTHGLLSFAFLLALPAAEPSLPLPKATTITLVVEKTRLSVVLADLSKQAGVLVEDKRGEADDEITLNLKGATYWQAIDAVAESVHANVNINPRDGRVSLTKRKDKAKQQTTSSDGLFRAAVKRVTAVRDFDTESSVYTAGVEITWEPRLLPLFLETQPRGFKIKDENGNNLTVRQEGSSLASVDGRATLVIDLPLPPLDRSTKKIGNLQGTLTAIAPSRMLQLAFKFLDQAEKQQVIQDGVTCTITKVDLKSTDHWSVRVSLEYPPGGPKFESYQSWVVNNEMVLENKDGKIKPLASSSYVLEGSTPQRAVLTYHFTAKDRGKPEDWKVLYRTPASIVEIPFTFSFKDVELP
jgi:hypothetical protein